MNPTRPPRRSVQHILILYWRVLEAGGLPPDIRRLILRLLHAHAWRLDWAATMEALPNVSRNRHGDRHAGLALWRQRVQPDLIYSVGRCYSVVLADAPFGPTRFYRMPGTAGAMIGCWKRAQAADCSAQYRRLVVGDVEK